MNLMLCLIPVKTQPLTFLETTQPLAVPIAVLCFWSGAGTELREGAGPPRTELSCLCSVLLSRELSEESFQIPTCQHRFEGGSNFRGQVPQEHILIPGTGTEDGYKSRVYLWHCRHSAPHTRSPPPSPQTVLYRAHAEPRTPADGD